MASSKLRIAWFTHLARPNEVVSTVSQYCSDILIPLMREEFDIEVFSGLAPGTHLGLPRYNTLNAYQRHRQQPFDLFFYQVEDGPLGRVVRTQVGVMPGITWMHDTFLSDPGAEGIHTSPWERSVQQMLDLSLPFLERDDLPLQPQPQGYRETSVSPVVLYNSEWGEGTLHRFVSGRFEYAACGHRSDFLPVPVSLIADARPVGLHRPLQVLALGTTRLEGRAHKLLPAFADCKVPAALTWVIDPSERADALRMVQEFGLAERVTLIEVNSPERWSSLVAQSDVALHLSSNPHGRLSPYLELSMAAGVPTVVMRSGRGETLPEDAVFSIEPGLHETAQLIGVLEALAKCDARVFGKAGQAFVQEHNDPVRVAAQLGSIFRESAPLLTSVMKAWEGLYARGEQALMEEIKSLTDAPVGGMPGAFETIVAPFVAELRRSVS
jgi:glycosyltransferase involved in cell wall biosynthesis